MFLKCLNYIQFRKSGAKERFFFYMSKLFDEKDSRLCTNPIKLCMFLAPKSEMYEGFFLFLLFVLTAFFSIPFSAFYNF